MQTNLPIMMIIQKSSSSLFVVKMKYHVYRLLKLYQTLQDVF